MTFDAGTFIDLEESLAAEFESMFAERTFMNSIGHSVPLKCYVHSLPVKQGDDDVLLDEHLPEPYIVSEINGGKKATDDDAHIITVAVIICVCDDNTARHGHQDILSIIQRIVERFGKNPVLGGRFVMRPALDWSLSDEDTYPYYYGGLLMQFEVPAIEKEDELA